MNKLIIRFALIVFFLMPLASKASSYSSEDIAGLEKSCSGSFMKACYELAGIYGNGKIVKQDIKRSINYLYKACEGGLVKSCEMLDGLMENGLRKEKDACENNNNTLNCSYVGLMYYMSNNYGKAEKYLIKACNENDSKSCQLVASIYFNGTARLNKKTDLAMKYYRKACELGLGSSCVAVGSIYGLGKDIKQDYFAAFDYYKRGCESDDAEGCYLLGMLYENGLGCRVSIKSAINYYGKACDLRDQRGCDSYAKSKNK